MCVPGRKFDTTKVASNAPVEPTLPVALTDIPSTATIGVPDEAA